MNAPLWNGEKVGEHIIDRARLIDSEVAICPPAEHTERACNNLISI